MKKFYLFVQLCVLGLVLATCSDDTEPDVIPPTPAPTIKMGLQSVEINSATVNILVTNADVCKWICQTSDTPLPSMEEILASGNAMNLRVDTVLKAENLNPDTEYVFLAAAKGQSGSVLSAPVKATTLEEEGPEQIEAKVLVEATYRNDNKEGAGQYGIIISNAEPAASGDPANVGDFQIFFDLFNEADEDPMNAVLPAGEYKSSADMKPFTWNPTKGMFYTRTSEGSDGLSPVPFLDGTVTVAHIEGGYDILIEGTLLSGIELNAHYQGDIQFVQTGTSNERFTKDQNVTFEQAKGFYYGNWFRYFADDMNLEFFAGSFDSNGKQTDGYYLSVPAFMDKLADPYSKNVRLQEGTYSIIDRKLSSQNTIPMILQKGEHVDLFGDFYDVGTYMTHLNGRNGRILLGLCVEGTMTVKHVGQGYKIDFKFKTPEGVTLTGVYEGDLNLENRCDNNEHEPKRPWSTLKGDRVLNIPSDAVAEAYLMGDYLLPGLNVWMLVVSPTEESTPGDMFTTELFTTGETFDLGTYEIKKEFKSFCALPGFIEYAGTPLYSWVGDLADLDADGYAKTLAPISEGNFVYTQEGDAKKFVFNMTDDAGNKVTGSWTGQVQTFDVREDAKAQAAVMSRVMKCNSNK